MSYIDKDTTIFIDFDDTLFDYSKAVNWILEDLAGYGITKDDWDETYAQVKKSYGLYDRTEHFRLMSQRVPGEIDLKAIREKYMVKTGDGIFKDAIEFLKKYKDHPIHIISYGETHYQKEKIANTGIEQYVQSVVVTSGSKADAINAIPYKKAIYIDDMPKYLRDVDANCKNVQTILIDRLGQHDVSKVRVYDVVTNLNEI